MARPKKMIAQDATQDVSQVETDISQPNDVNSQAETDNPRVEIFDTGKNIVKVAPVYGAMHHPFQNIRIEGETLVEMDSWVECQVAAGKLTLC